MQDKFLRFISFKCNILRPSYSGYENILKLLNLKPLLERRNVSYINFLTNILNNMIYDSFLLSQINFNVNTHNLRNQKLFYISNSSLKYMHSSPINMLSTQGNFVNTTIDFLK